MVRSEELRLEAIGRFVTASEEVRFEAEDRQQLYGWVEQVLVGRQYAQMGKAARGLVRRPGAAAWCGARYDFRRSLVQPAPPHQPFC